MSGCLSERKKRAESGRMRSEGQTQTIRRWRTMAMPQTKRMHQALPVQSRSQTLSRFHSGKEDPTHEHKTFKMMREMKEREVEHVRFRSSRDHAADASIQAAAQSMRMVALAALKPTQNELKSLCGTR